MDVHIVRCSWGDGSEEYVRYHDDEWGRPVTDRTRLFEKLSLEGFQSGLSWITILRKRPSFRAGFDGFVPETVAAYGPAEVERLLGDAGIVRHRGKIESTINNARRLLELEADVGDAAHWLWRNWFDPAPTPPDPIPATTPSSIDLAKTLKRAGFTFVGPTTVYAMMQSVGLVNDHELDCFAHEPCQTERIAVATRMSATG